MQINSTSSLAGEVFAKANGGTDSPPGARRYLKTPEAVATDKIVQTSPTDVLRELGVATTLLTRSPFVAVAQQWAHLRYCATLTNSPKGMLALTRHAADEVVHHHKMVQSEQLGIGLALVVARAALARRHPGVVFHAVDADVALAAGFIEGVSGEVRNAAGTRKRPDYFLIGWDRGVVHVVVLECKGTHFKRADVVKQLADACLQVRAVQVGTHTLYSLMVASQLSKNGITSHILDPPGNDGLWSGTEDELDELLAEVPEEQDWRPEEPSTSDASDDGGPATQTPPVPDSPEPPDGTTSPQPPQPPAPFHIPEVRRGWFTQVLTRATAASVLLFAGNSSAASDYTTPRQRGELSGALPGTEEPWPDTTNDQLTLPGGPTLEGTSMPMPLTNGKTLIVFRGVEQQVYRQLRDGDLRAYRRNAGSLYRWWHAGRASRLPGGALSVGLDGTALLLRVANDPRDTDRK
ncbi:hypothetical protein Drose_17065 [Dactylosporangium roseum]|uniref:Uncharacterized protein n=1 Tax=Dactylosporangium roseum TaxID=47989 RepID=A0ABY5ZFP5_9ACTN|nr:hypothetical protein [Dactylosporangium roseum]UWZ39778.1 hypothetical protein Drose_17065 [Dactylosporangium roseum]